MLKALWEKRLKQDSEGTFVTVARPRQTRTQRYSFGAFYKRAGQVGVALESVLKLEPGEVVALCIDDPDEFALLLHGSWLAGISVGG